VMARPANLIEAFATLLVGVSAAGLVAGCDDGTTDPPEEAKIYLVALIDPDLTDTSAPVPGRILWISSRAGRARFESGGREVADQAQVVGGELATTTVDPLDLVPGVNTIDITLVIQQGGGEIFEQARLNVAAECTWHEQCSGSCIQFRCQ